MALKGWHGGESLLNFDARIPIYETMLGHGRQYQRTAVEESLTSSTFRDASGADVKRQVSEGLLEGCGANMKSE